jgi:hydrogenase maturation factor HypE
MIGARLLVAAILIASGVIACGVSLAAVVVMGTVESIVHVPVNKCVRLGELGRVQNGQLTSTEQRHGEEHGNHRLFHEAAHSAIKRPASPRCVKCGIVGESFPSVT